MLVEAKLLARTQDSVPREQPPLPGVMQADVRGAVTGRGHDLEATLGRLHGLPESSGLDGFWLSPTAVPVGRQPGWIGQHIVDKGRCVHLCALLGHGGCQAHVILVPVRKQHVRDRGRIPVLEHSLGLVWRARVHEHGTDPVEVRGDRSNAEDVAPGGDALDAVALLA